MDLFRQHFKGFAKAFIVIGGVACDEWLTSQGLSFRATKDVDMVLIIEALSADFIKHFWSFVAAAGYDPAYHVEGRRVYYRFVKPQNTAYPAMIELFSREPDHLDLADGQQIVPISVDEDISSLSAILMDESYYKLIRDHRNLEADLPLLEPSALIPLKARAWLDLEQRQRAGSKVDSRALKKHRNDVFRLAATLPDEAGPEIVEVIRADLRAFLAPLSPSSTDWSSIIDALRPLFGRATPQPADLLGALNGYFKLG